MLEKGKLVAGYEGELEEIRGQVRELEGVVQKRQIEAELEMENMKQRMTKLQAEEIGNRRKQYEVEVEGLRKDIDDLKKIVAAHE